MHDIIKEKDINNFKVTYRKHQKKGGYELLVKHLTAGNHFAVHNKVQLVDEDGKFLEMVDIENVNIDQLFDNIEKFGTTEGLYVSKENKFNRIKDIQPEEKYISNENNPPKVNIQF